MGGKRGRMPKIRKNDPGIYIIKLVKAAFGLPAGRIIYIGKGDDVQNRLNQELGKATGPATFFRSIGVMLNKTVIPGSGKNYKFYERQEIVDWLNEHTAHFVKRCDWGKQEKDLIKKHRPPFNFIHNSRYYYPRLLELRQKAKAIAMRYTAT
jgi:hypothetical protein